MSNNTYKKRFSDELKLFFFNIFFNLLSMTPTFSLTFSPTLICTFEIIIFFSRNKILNIQEKNIKKRREQNNLPLDVIVTKVC